jgi:hypothetical protein
MAPTNSSIPISVKERDAPDGAGGQVLLDAGRLDDHLVPQLAEVHGRADLDAVHPWHQGVGGGGRGGGRHGVHLHVGDVVGGAQQPLASLPGAAQPPEEQHEPDDEAEVAEAVDDEGLHAGRGLLRVGVPEGDEQVGGEADALPAEEHHREVVTHDQQQHREDEEVQVAEEAPVGRLLRHVADREDVDEHPDAGDDQHHQH